MWLHISITFGISAAVRMRNVSADNLRVVMPDSDSLVLFRLTFPVISQTQVSAVIFEKLFGQTSLIDWPSYHRVCAWRPVLHFKTKVYTGTKTPPSPLQHRNSERSFPALTPCCTSAFVLPAHPSPYTFMQYAAFMHEDRIAIRYMHVKR